MNDLLAAQRHAQRNRAEIEASTLCGCFYCLQMFEPAAIVAWGGLDMNSFTNPDSAADAETALCPHCGSDAVIGNASGLELTAAFLGRMHEAWFQRTIIRKPASKT